MTLLELKEKHPVAYILAIENIQLQHPKCQVDSSMGSHIDSLFDWYLSPQGGPVWKDTNSGDFSKLNDWIHENRPQLVIPEKKQKYYFITWQATPWDNFASKRMWSTVIDQSPMAFIINAERIEREANRTYRDFLVINTLEITEDEFKEFKGQF